MTDALDKLNNDNTLIFKKNHSNNGKAFNIKTSNHDKDDNIYKNCLVEWSPTLNDSVKNSNIFYSTIRKCNSTESNECTIWYEEVEFNFIKEFNSNPFIVVNRPLSKVDSEFYLEAESVTKYLLTAPTKKEIDISSASRNFLPVIHVLYDKSSKGYDTSVSTNHSIVKPVIDVNKYESIVDFDIKMSNEDNNPTNRFTTLFNEKSSIYQNRIHFACQTETGIQISIPLYPNKNIENADQIEPRFNHDGTIASFLSFQPNSNSHFELYTVDLGNANDCGLFIDTHRKNPNKLLYKKIDNYIVNDDYKDGYPNQRFTSYCWHPNKNIIFYIKRDKLKDEQSSKTYSIYYYNLDKNDGPHLLDIPTNYNSYLSMSEDGKYLLFSFTSLKSGYQNKDVFNNSDIIQMNAYNKIGLAKLIYD